MKQGNLYIRFQTSSSIGQLSLKKASISIETCVGGSYLDGISCTGT